MSEDLRAQCLELGAEAMGRNDGWRWWHPRHLAKLFDLWEPILRADERRECETDWHPQSAVGYVKMRASIDAEVRTQVAGELRTLAERARTAPRGVLTSVETQAAVLLLAADQVEKGTP